MDRTPCSPRLTHPFSASSTPHSCPAGPSSRARQAEAGRPSGEARGLRRVDVTGVEATDNPLKDVNVTRPDETKPCLTQQQALAAAPEAVDGRFAVPQILGESQ